LENMSPKKSSFFLLTPSLSHIIQIQAAAAFYVGILLKIENCKCPELSI